MQLQRSAKSPTFSVKRTKYRLLLTEKLQAVVLNCCTGHRANYAAVGLTDTSPEVTTPVWLTNYAVCAQLPSSVADATTYTLMCDSNMPPYRYLIVQFPIHNYACLCELEVYIRRKFLTIHRVSEKNVPLYRVAEKSKLLYSDRYFNG